MSIEKTIEHISIGLSALGTVMAIATQQLAYAATPLTLSLAVSLSNRQREITKANLRIANLEQRFANISSRTDTIDKKSDSLFDMDGRISDLDVSITYLYDSNRGLDNRIREVIDTAVTSENIGQLIWQAVDTSTKEQFDVLKQMLPKKYSYDLIYGREESRQVFSEALEQSQENLVFVCPWITTYAMNPAAKNLFESALKRGVSIKVGWGHLIDVGNDRSRLSKDSLLQSKKAKSWGGYNAIPWLYDLQSEYPRLLKIEILGTHEKFLVCDKKFAMLGSHNFMTSGNSSSEREIGIKTNSLEIIKSLIERFDKFETIDKQFAENLN